MIVSNDIKLDFRDVLIRPKLTDLVSRSQVELERTYDFKNGETIKSLPIMAANMDTIGTMEVFKSLHPHGIITCFHKFIDHQEVIENKSLLESNMDLFAFSIGFKTEELENLVKLSKEINFKLICIDIANGYIKDFVHFCKKVRDTFPDKIIIAGNVVTPEMVEKLFQEGGVDIVKVGIGGGSACTTRIKTGVGYPQLSCVMECYKKARLHQGYIISDGGITCPGDLGKALGGGADFAMMGGQFSGHDENPGEIVEEEGKKYKLFYGMSSSHAMKKNYNKVEKYRTSEGRCLKVPYKGSISETVEDFLGGLRSLCTYVNCRKVESLHCHIDFIRVNSQFNSSLLR